jgi:hypothetical protein
MYVNFYGVHLYHVDAVLLGLALVWAFLHLHLGGLLRRRANKRASIKRALKRPTYTRIKPT